MLFTRPGVAGDLLQTPRHAICHDCTDIIRVKYFFGGVNFSLNIRCFAEKSAFVAFYSLLVTHLVAHRLTLGNSILVIPIIYLLKGNIARIMDGYYVK